MLVILKSVFILTKWQMIAQKHYWVQLEVQQFPQIGIQYLFRQFIFNLELFIGWPLILIHLVVQFSQTQIILLFIIRLILLLMILKLLGLVQVHTEILLHKEYKFGVILVLHLKVSLPQSLVRHL